MNPQILEQLHKHGMTPVDKVCLPCVESMTFREVEECIEEIRCNAIISTMKMCAEMCVRYKEYGDLHPPIEVRRVIRSTLNQLENK